MMEGDGDRMATATASTRCQANALPTPGSLQVATWLGSEHLADALVCGLQDWCSGASMVS